MKRKKWGTLTGKIQIFPDDCRLLLKNGNLPAISRLVGTLINVLTKMDAEFKETPFYFPLRVRCPKVRKGHSIYFTDGGQCDGVYGPHKGEYSVQKLQTQT